MSNGAAPPNATERPSQPVCWADMSSDEEDAFGTVLTDFSSAAQHKPPAPTPLQNKHPGSMDLGDPQGRGPRGLPRRPSGQRGAGGQRPYPSQMGRPNQYGGGMGAGRDRKPQIASRNQGPRPGGAYGGSHAPRMGGGHPINAAPSPELPEQDLGPPYKVHVGSLPLNVTQEQIVNAFKPLEVLSVDIPHAARSDHSSAFAFVEVAHFDDQRKAIQHVNGMCIGSRPMSVRMPRRRSLGRRPDPPFRVASRFKESGSKGGDDAASIGSHTQDSGPPIRPGTDGGLHPGHTKHRFNLSALSAAVSSTDDTKRNASIFGLGRPREEKPAVAESSGANTSEEMSAGQLPSQSAPVVDAPSRPSGADFARQNSPRQGGEGPPEMVVTMPANYLASPKRTEVVETQAAPPPSNQSSSSSNRGRTERPSYASVLRAPQSPVVAPQAALISTAPQQPRTRTGRGRAVAKSKHAAAAAAVAQKRAGRSDSDRTSDFESFAKRKHRI